LLKNAYIFSLYNFNENFFFQKFIKKKFFQPTPVSTLTKIINTLNSKQLQKHFSDFSKNINELKLSVSNNATVDSINQHPSHKTYQEKIKTDALLLNNNSRTNGPLINFFTFNEFFLIAATPLFYKFFSHKFKDLCNENRDAGFVNFLLNSKFKTFFFYSSMDNTNRSNLIPTNKFYYLFKKKIIKTFTYDKFTLLSAPFYTNSLVRFFEFCSGKKVAVRLYTFINSLLTYSEKALCLN
jgi:hypothetical protein